MKKLITKSIRVTLLAGLVFLAAGLTAAATVGENILPNGDFEKGKLDGVNYFFQTDANSNIDAVTADTITIGEAEQTIVPHGGDYMLKIATPQGGVVGAPSNTYMTISIGHITGGLEKGATYKISFWYRCANAPRVPNIYFVLGGAHIQCNGAFYMVPAPAQNTWTYYEVYLTTRDDETAMASDVRFRTSGVAADIIYYDDIKIQKVTDADIRFSTTAVSTSDITNLTNGGYPANATPQKTLPLNGETAWIYPVAAKLSTAEGLGGTIYVTAQYMPKRVDETAYLVAGIFERISGGGELLVDLKAISESFAGTPATAAGNTANLDTTTVTRDDLTFDHYVMTDNMITLSIDTSAYTDSKYYMKAFLWSDAQGLIPLSDVASLGN